MAGGPAEDITKGQEREAAAATQRKGCPRLFPRPSRVKAYRARRGDGTRPVSIREACSLFALSEKREESSSKPPGLKTTVLAKLKPTARGKAKAIGPRRQTPPKPASRREDGWAYSTFQVGRRGNLTVPAALDNGPGGGKMFFRALQTGERVGGGSGEIREDARAIKKPFRTKKGKNTRQKQRTLEEQ